MDIDGDEDRTVTRHSTSTGARGPGEEELVAAARGSTGRSQLAAIFWEITDVAPAPPADDELSPESAALGALAEAFTTLTQELAGDRGVTPVSPAQVIQLAVDCVPRVQYAALVMEVDGKVRTVARTPNLPDRIDEIRSATSQGPGLDVLRTNELVLSNDLGTDPRWPLFGSRLVDELGLRSTVGYRLRLGTHDRAALCFYSPWPYAFDNLAITTGTLFATYCSLVTLSCIPRRPG